MRTDWLKMVCMAGLILAACGWGVVTAAEMKQEEQIMVNR
jgi:hypothetical protein